MEREFLLGIDFDLYVDKNTYDGWLRVLTGLVSHKEQDSKMWKRTRCPVRTSHLHRPQCHRNAHLTTYTAPDRRRRAAPQYVPLRIPCRTSRILTTILPPRHHPRSPCLRLSLTPLQRGPRFPPVTSAPLPMPSRPPPRHSRLCSSHPPRCPGACRGSRSTFRSPPHTHTLGKAPHRLWSRCSLSRSCRSAHPLWTWCPTLGPPGTTSIPVHWCLHIGWMTSVRRLHLR